jgi:hypothetical protein
MDSTNTDGGSDESDAMEDAEFIEEHEKYLEYCERRTIELLKAEEDRQNVQILLKNFHANVIIASSKCDQ